MRFKTAVEKSERIESGKLVESTVKTLHDLWSKVSEVLERSYKLLQYRVQDHCV